MFIYYRYLDDNSTLYKITIEFLTI